MKLLPFLALYSLVASPCLADSAKELWAKKLDYDAQIIGMDQAGNVAFTQRPPDRRRYQLHVGKLASDDGHLLWMVTHGGVLEGPEAVATAVDPKGDVIVSASYPRFGYQTIIYRVTVRTRYSGADGTIRWQLVGHDIASPEYMVLDGHGGFTVAAYKNFPGGDHVVANYSLDDGSLRWKTLIPSYGFYTFPTTLHAVPSGPGGVIVTRMDPYFTQHMEVFRLDREGNVLWQKGFARPSGQTSLLFPEFLSTVNSKGDLALVFPKVNSISDIEYYSQYVTKLSAVDGHYLWKKLRKPRGQTYTSPTSAVMNSRGDVIVATDDIASDTRSSVVSTFAARKGTLASTLRRSHSIDSALAIDADDSLYVVDSLKDEDSPHPDQILTTKRDRDGKVLWTEKHPSKGYTDIIQVIPGAGTLVVKALLADNTPLFIKYADGATPITGSAFDTRTKYPRLSGSVFAYGYAGSAAFEYGRDPNLEDATATEFVPITDAPTPFSFETTLSGLQPDTLYYYRTIATANGNTTRGIIRNFRTFP